MAGLSSIPTKKPCPTCRTEVDCVRVLSCCCDQELCPACFDKAHSADKKSFSCPNCKRKISVSPFNSAPKIRRFGELRCDSCHMSKDCEDSWFCKDCVEVSCSKCVVRNHRNHKVSEWNCMEGVAVSWHNVCSAFKNEDILKICAKSVTKMNSQLKELGLSSDYYAFGQNWTKIPDSVNQKITKTVQDMQKPMEQLEKSLMEMYGISPTLGKLSPRKIPSSAKATAVVQAQQSGAISTRYLAILERAFLLAGQGEIWQEFDGGRAQKPVFKLDVSRQDIVEFLQSKIIVAQQDAEN